jgi:hypothetical protein
MYSEQLDRIERKLDQLLGLSSRIHHGEDVIMANLDQLTTDVAANTTVEQSAITLITGLKAELDAAGTDPVKLAALSSQLEASSSALAAAVSANTPAAPPAPAPVPAPATNP